MHTTVKRFAFLAAAGIAAMLVMWQPLQSRGTDEDGWKQVRWRFDAKQPLKLEMAERPLAEAAVPAKALQALRRAASDHQLVAFEEEIRDGQSYYEGEWQTGRGTAEATVTADGVLVETEREVSAEKVPRGIREAAEKLSQGQEVSFARRCVLYYEIEYVQEGQQREVLLSPGGETIGTEISAQPDSTQDDID